MEGLRGWQIRNKTGEFFDGDRALGMDGERRSIGSESRLQSLLDPEVGTGAVARVHRQGGCLWMGRQQGQRSILENVYVF